MARPSLVSTVFPLIAFAMGVIIGAYLPPGLLPGTGPDAPPPPTPREAFNSLWEEITGGPVDESNPDQAGSDTTPATNGSGSTTGNTPSGGNPDATPATPDAIAAERERRKQAALAINRQPLKLVGVIDGRTVVVEDGNRARYRVTLAGVDRADPDVANQLMRFVLQRVSLDVTESVLDERGRIPALVHVLPASWQPADEIPTDNRRSLNAAVIRALAQR